jgi:uncharacterized protein
MPAAASPRPGAPSTDVRRPAADPWKLDLREWNATLPAPDGWGVELIGVPEGAPVQLHLRLESVMEGVLVSGQVDVPVTGQCARCLDPVTDALELDVQELYAYAGSTTEATSEEDEVRRIDGEHLDLAPLVRDAVVLTLPLSPTCTPDCAGLCVDCGERLDDLPADHSHEVVDPRWAGLAARLAATTDAAEKTDSAEGPQPGSPRTNPEEI